jgi:hypothetical protein
MRWAFVGPTVSNLVQDFGARDSFVANLMSFSKKDSRVVSLTDDSFRLVAFVAYG